LSFMTFSNHQHSIEAAELLANSTARETFDLVLNNTIFRPISHNELWKIHSLIEWGASQASLHLAFCVALYENRYEQFPIVIDFFQEFIASGLDINDQFGECLRVAADCGQARILQDLLGTTTNSKAQSIALSAAILAGHEESMLLSLIDVIESAKKGGVAFQPYTAGHSPHLFECLRMYPNSRVLAERLIKMGCSTESTIEFVLPEEYGAGDEGVTVIFWAIYQVLLCIEGQVSDDVLDVLMESSKYSPRILKQDLLIFLCSKVT
jgi:hypothetical protein